MLSAIPLLSNLKEGYQIRLVNLEAEKWHKEREERLLEVAFEKTRMNTIVNSITDGVLVVNKDGLAVLYNLVCKQHIVNLTFGCLFCCYACKVFACFNLKVTVLNKNTVKN